MSRRGRCDMPWIHYYIYIHVYTIIYVFIMCIYIYIYIYILYIYIHSIYIYINNHTCLHRIGKQRSENHVPSGGDRGRPGATWAAAPAPSHGWDFWRSPHWGPQGGLKPLPPRIQIWKWGGYHGVPMKAIEIMGKIIVKSINQWI